jgi:hypothetical protein
MIPSVAMTAEAFLFCGVGAVGAVGLQDFFRLFFTFRLFFFSTFRKTAFL